MQRTGRRPHHLLRSYSNQLQPHTNCRKWNMLRTLGEYMFQDKDLDRYIHC
jgi:hypothetical protein